MTTTTEPPPRSAGLYRLLAWLSPSFPIGAFSYSHGLEAAVAYDAVRDRPTLQRWIAAIVALGSGRTDADILRDAYQAHVAGDLARVAAANRRGWAYRPTAELALESEQQGAAFRATWRAAWDEAPAGELSGLASAEGVCLPAMLGVAAAEAGMPLDDILLGYLQALAGNLVSAGLRLGVIGQTDGQRIIAALEPLVSAAVAAALSRDPEDFGGATFALDVASMGHETQYSRLFRS